MSVQPSGDEPRCVRLASCSFAVADWAWPWAAEARRCHRARLGASARIGAATFRWTRLSVARAGIDGATLTGTLFKTDFRRFLYWRDRRAEEKGVCEVFGASLIRSAEGHVLLGRQGPGQLNSGRVYPPSGLIDGDDLRDGAIDIDASIARELAEETGLAPGSLERVPGYIAAVSGWQVAVAIEWRSPLAAEALRQRILGFIEAEAEPELDDIVIVRQRCRHRRAHHAAACAGAAADAFASLTAPR